MQNLNIIQFKYPAIKGHQIKLLQYRLTKSGHDNDRVIWYEVKVRLYVAGDKECIILFIICGWFSFRREHLLTVQKWIEIKQSPKLRSV